MSGASDALHEQTASAGPRGTLEVAPGRPWRDLGERIVLYDQIEGEETELLGSGVVVWRLIAPRCPVAELTVALRALLGDDTAELGEAMGFIEELIQRGLLRRG